MEGSSKRLPVWGPTPSLQSKGENFPTKLLEADRGDLGFFFLKGKFHPRNHAGFINPTHTTPKTNPGGGLAC